MTRNPRSKPKALRCASNPYLLLPSLIYKPPSDGLGVENWKPDFSAVCCEGILRETCPGLYQDLAIP